MKQLLADILRRIADYLDPPQARYDEGETQSGQVMTQDGPFPPNPNK